jgi:hypothetical protein
MADITDVALAELVNSMNKSTGLLKQIADNLDATAAGKSNARQILRKNLQDDTKSTQDHVKALKSSTDQFLKNTSSSKSMMNALPGFMSKFARGLDNAVDKMTGNRPSNNKMIYGGMATAGFFLESFLKYGQESAKVMKDLSNYGQTFSGSMFTMSRAAAQAGLPLDELATVIKKNSVVIANVGLKDFTGLSKRVRELTDAAGNYGFTLEQMNDLQGIALDTQRLTGDKSAKNTKSQAKAVQEFALSVSSMAVITGKLREQIIQDGKAALDTEVLVATMQQTTKAGMGTYNKAIEKVVYDLAAQTGQAGTMLSQAFAETAGGIGPQFSDLGQKLLDQGLGQGVDFLQQLQDNIANGMDPDEATASFNTQMKQLLTNPQVLQMLKVNASTGDATAKSLIKLGSEITVYTAAQKKANSADIERQKKVTNFFTAFDSVFKRLRGKFVDALLKPLESIESAMGEGGAFDKLAPLFEKLGTNLGLFISETVTPQNIERFASMLDMLFKVGSALVTAGTFIAGFFLDSLRFVHKQLGFLGETGSLVVTSFVGLVAFLKAKQALGMLMGNSKMHVTAGVVNINAASVNGGGGGGGVLDDLVEGKGRRRRGKGWRKGAGSAKRMAAVEQRLFRSKGIGGKLGMAAEKYGSKGLTGVLEVAGAGSKVAKFGSGLTKGAGLLGVAITAGMAVNDMVKIKEAVDSGKITPEEAKKKLAKLTGGLAGGALGAAGGAQIGALIGGVVGSIVPGPGTVIGAVIGGAAGSAIGAWAGAKGGEAIGGFAYDKLSGKKAPSGTVKSPTGKPLPGAPLGSGDLGYVPKQSAGSDETAKEMRQMRLMLEQQGQTNLRLQKENNDLLRKTNGTLTDGMK